MLIYIYIFIYVCMYVSMHVCMHLNPVLTGLTHALNKGLKVSHTLANGPEIKAQYSLLMCASHFVLTISLA